MQDYNAISLSLARATEATARAVMPLSGKADKEQADHLAVEEMRSTLNDLDLNLHIHLGEGEKDQAPMLYKGERLGKRSGDGEKDLIDLVVDPLECTTNFSRGLPDSMTVIFAAPAGSIKSIPGTYMDQILVPPEASHLLGDRIHLDGDERDILSAVADSLERRVEDLTVVVQDRPRHKELINKIHAAGAGVSLIESGSLSAAAEIILKPHGRLDMLWGRFGAPEGLIMAGMANLAGFGFLGRIAPHNEEFFEQAREMEILNLELDSSGWVGADGLLVMSGIHSSTWLKGVERSFHQQSSSYKVHSLLWQPGELYSLVHEDGQLKENRPFQVP